MERGSLWTAVDVPHCGGSRFLMFWMILFLEHQAFVAAYRVCSAAGRVLVKAFVGGCLLVAAALLFSGFAMPYRMLPCCL